MKKLLLFILLATFSICLNAQVYLADTSMYTDHLASGSGSTCSIQYGTLGSLMNKASNYWIADDFTVPTGATWSLDNVVIYGYMTNSSPTSNPFVDGYMQIFNGNPSTGGTVIWGTTSANVFQKATFSNIYRQDPVTPDLNRPIYAIKFKLPFPPNLTAGTYWVAWSTTLTGSFTGPWAVPKILPNRTLPANQNAVISSAGTWSAITDGMVTPKTPLGMNMIFGGPVSSVPLINNEEAFTLKQNVPNPFNKSTNILFSLAHSGRVNVTIYNSVGQLTSTVIDENMSAGDHAMLFNAGSLAPGIYYCQLRTEEGIESKTMEITK